MVDKSILLTLLLFICSWTHAEPPLNTTEAPQLLTASRDYLLGPGDVLDISVWKEEDLRKEVLVRPDGGITFPLLGELRAEGKTLDQLAAELTQTLSEYLSEPLVNVALQKVGQTIYVVGKVNKPGDFPVATRIDVMQALSMAGGLTPYADADDIHILRRNQGQVTSLDFDYDAVSQGDDLEQNIPLQRGDVIVVP